MPRRRGSLTAGGSAVASTTLGDLVRLPAFERTVLVPSSADTTIELTDAGPVGGVVHDHRLTIAEAAPVKPPVTAGAVVAMASPPDDYPVPVIVLPEGASWTAVLEEIADRLGPRRGRRAAEEAREALRAPLLAGEGFQGIARVCSESIGAPVALLDDYMDLLAATDLDPEHEAVLNDAARDARGRGPASILGSFLEHIPDEVTVCTVGEDPHQLAGVVVAWLEPPLKLEHDAAIRETVRACALEMSRQDLRTRTESALRGDLIRELAAGESVSRESLIRRARHLGADLAAGAVALLGHLQDPHEPDRTISDERLIRRFLHQTRAVLDMHWPRALVDWDEGRLLVLLPGPRDEDEADPATVEERARVLAGRLIAATRETVRGLALSLATSRFTPQPERLGAAMEEAGLALSIGERLGRIGDVVTFEETGTYKLLFQIFADRPDELAAFYEQTIDPLVRYDEQYQTELVATLATYLEYDCNLAATANTLFTHRHTVRYRLDRIAELCGLEIGRTDDREKLSLGLKAMRLMGRRVPQPIAKEATRGRAKR